MPEVVGRVREHVLDEEDCGLLMAALGLWKDEYRENLSLVEVERIERLDELLGGEVHIRINERA